MEVREQKNWIMFFSVSQNETMEISEFLKLSNTPLSLSVKVPISQMKK